MGRYWAETLVDFFKRVLAGTLTISTDETGANMSGGSVAVDPETHIVEHLTHLRARTFTSYNVT